MAFEHSGLELSVSGKLLANANVARIERHIRISSKAGNMRYILYSYPATSGFRQGKGNQMSLLVFYNALLSTLGKHLGIIGTTTRV